MDEKPDLVLMDIRMPGMNGREALEAIRSHPECGILPVLAVTASSLSEEEGELRRPFDGYIRKPFTRAELYREIALFVPKHEDGGSNTSPIAGDPQALSPELLLSLAGSRRALARHGTRGLARCAGRDGHV